MAEAAQDSDQLFILRGTSMLFILWPEHTCNCFLIVAEVYVHDIMQGEAAATGGLQFQDMEVEWLSCRSSCRYKSLS